jgi:hypothetical protein
MGSARFDFDDRTAFRSCLGFFWTKSLLMSHSDCGHRKVVSHSAQTFLRIPEIVNADSGRP